MIDPNEHDNDEHDGYGHGHDGGDGHRRPSVWRRLMWFPMVILVALESVSAVLDKFFSTVLSKGSRVVGDRINQADSVLARVGNVAGMPFRVVGQSIAYLFVLLGVRHWGPTIGRWSRPVWYPIVAFGNFLVVLVKTRPRAILIWSLPLLVILGPIFYLLFRVLMVDQQAITTRYRLAVVEAIESEDYVRAELFENKLIQLGAANERFEYEGAVRLEEEGKLDAAFQIMSKLGPEARTGYGAAHFWLARNLLNGKLPFNNQESLRLAGVHLRHARTVGKNIPEVEYLFAVLEVKLGQVESALRRLRKLQDRLLAAALLKLDIDLELNRETDSRFSSVSLLRHVREHPDIDGLADNTLYRLWASAERLAGTRDGMVSVLTRWNAKYPDDVNAQSELSTVRLEELERQMETAARIDVPEMTTHLLEAGRMVDPARRDQLADLIRLLLSRRQTSREIAEVLENLELAVDVPAVILEQLGTNAILRNDYPSARRLLEQSVKNNPDDFVAWNNLAFLLNTQYPDETEVALKAANNAVRLSVNNVQARETRGMILARMSRWQDAITDLEIAINGTTNASHLHRALSQAYRNLGNDLLADAHQRQAGR